MLSAVRLDPLIPIEPIVLLYHVIEQGQDLGDRP